MAEGVGVHFEGLRAVESVNLRLEKGEILGLIGPNGAGKTTLVNVLTGLQRPNEGKVLVDGVDATSWNACNFAHRGVARTFQAARLFLDMSALENVEMPGFALGLKRAEARERALKTLDFMGVAGRAEVKAAALSYGEQRLVGIARALALRPKFLLLDEPAAGMSPVEAHDLLERIGALRERYGCGVLVIEHNMQLIMKLCDRVQVLARGATIAVGPPAEVQRSTAVREAYLGSDVTAEAAHEVEATKAAKPLLRIENLVVEYGAARALSGVSLTVGDGEFVAVIGPNGAGKSSLLSAVAGLVKPRAGTVVYAGQPLLAKPPARRVREGIALVPEGRRILGNLTVEENLIVGALVRRDDPETPRRLAEVLERFPVLRERFTGYAGLLSGGEQQQLAIARALMSGPRLLLLDEPSLGLAPMMIDQVYATLTDLRESGLSILLMEQNAGRALRVAHRAYVIRHGAIELQGEAAALRTDPRFDRAYFGFATGGEALTH